MTNISAFALLTADIICNLPTTAYSPKQTIAISMAGLPGVVVDTVFKLGIDDINSIASTLKNISSPLPFGSSYDRYLAEKSHGIWKIRTGMKMINGSNIPNMDVKVNINNYTPSSCIDVYRSLCRNYVGDVERKSVNELRVLYLSKQPDGGALLQDYIEIPYQLSKFHNLATFDGNSHNSKSSNIVKRIFRVWKMNIFLNNGVAEEFGLMSLLIFKINLSKS